MKKNADRNLTAIFCDDIRQEMGNKMSFMGCYHGELNVANAPVALSKLCVFASATTPPDKPFKALTLRIVQSDDIELARLEIPPDQLQQGALIVDPTATRKNVSTAIAFSPFFIEKPTSIRLMAITEEGEIVGPRLLINVAQQSQPSEKPIQESATTAKTGRRKPAARTKAAPVSR
jgi:hypothetical protein